MTAGQILDHGVGKAITLAGATAVFKVVTDRKPGDFDLLELTAAPGFPGPGPHVHYTHEELFYVLDGEFDFYIGGDVRRVGPGSFINIPPSVMHDYRNPGTIPARFLGIIAPAGMDGYFEEIRDLMAAGNLSDMEALRQLRLRYNTEEPENAPPGHWGKHRWR